MGGAADSYITFAVRKTNEHGLSNGMKARTYL